MSSSASGVRGESGRKRRRVRLYPKKGARSTRYVSYAGVGGARYLVRVIAPGSSKTGTVVPGVGWPMEGLECLPSMVRGAGRGLFTTKAFSRGSTITYMGGYEIDGHPINHYGDCCFDYSLDVPGVASVFMCGRDANVAKYRGWLANHSDGLGDDPAPNAELVTLHLSPPRGQRMEELRMGIVALRDIRIGEEILIDYGRDYIADWRDVILLS